jgi:hypothetical protein
MQNDNQKEGLSILFSQNIKIKKSRFMYNKILKPYLYLIKIKKISKILKKFYKIYCFYKNFVIFAIQESHFIYYILEYHFYTKHRKGYQFSF